MKRPVYNIDGAEFPHITTITGLLDKSSALMSWAVRCAVDYSYLKMNECKYLKETEWESNNYILDVDDFDIIMKEAKKEWRNVRDEACDIGTEVHSVIENHINDIFNKAESPSWQDLPSDTDERVMNGYTAFLDWEENNIDEWLESELVVVNKEMGYAGKLDAIAKLKNGKIYVIDFKSSKGFYDGYDLQISAYKKAYEASHTGFGTEKSYEIDGMGVLRLDKLTGKPEWKDYTDKYDRAIESFHHLVRYYYASKSRQLNNNPFVIKKTLKNKK